MTNWTADQQKAIYAPSGEGNILVSAAAGSGKTAVLVERIAQMILRHDDPISVENLLVVTFTEAAAAEMKERIIDRINKAQREAFETGGAAEAKRLREQIHLTTTADINTIDAFCLRAVRNNFHILGIDPNFGIMDNGEVDILAEDAMDDLFTSLYECEDEGVRERFENLVRIYASNRGDEGLGKVVRKLYDFSQSFPDPTKWLRQAADMYDENMADSVWMKECVFKTHRDYVTERTLGRFETLLDDMKNDTPPDVEPAVYWGSLWEKAGNCRDAAKMLKNAREWEDFVTFYNKCIADASYLGSGRNRYTKSVIADEETWRKYFNICDGPRKFFRETCALFPSVSKDEFNKSVHAGEIKRMADDLVWLAELFSAKYEERKAARNIKSFADVEHLAYRLFAENESIRGEYADRYREILIDEYQDTNGLQDSIFHLISTDCKNIFMVGDLKQSIYRFRGGDPMIFKERSRAYAGSDGGTLISLSQNFRSRIQVIDSINAVFSRMMTNEVGDVNYTGNEVLRRDADKDIYPERGGKAELYRVAAVKEEDGGTSRARAEASAAAERIKELVNENYKVYDKGKYRDIEYRDIVILMKSVKTDGAVFAEELEKRGIGAFVQKEEYFERREIKLMLSLISVINNHMQDIPLLAVMRSPIGGFTENELAKIRIASGARPFYRAVVNYAAPENPTDEETRLEKRCRLFTADLERWRGYVKRRSIASLIWMLLEETGIYDLMGATEGGEEAQANLRLLYERAKRYELSGFRGIFNFIRYIGRMERRREDIAGAQLVNSNHNVVRIMTIHKSKGLEFPVVLLAGTGKEIKYMHPGDETRVALHNKLGIGMDYYNYEDMYVKPLLFKEYVNNVNRQEQLSEEMRLLYVASTRAREKLIVTAAYEFGTRAKYEEKLAAWEMLKQDMPWDIERNAKCLADWIIPVAQSDNERWICRDVCASADDASENGETETLTEETDSAWRKSVKDILEYSYRYPKSGAIPAKTSVTAIKEMADEDNARNENPVYMASKPAFMRGENLGARIGTAHHQVMAYIDLDKMKTLGESGYEDFVAEEIKRIANAGQIESEIAGDREITDNICKNVCEFFRGNMGQSVLSAKRVYREQPFEIEISAREYDASLGEEYENESVVVQGIIDLFFEDADGNITLADYKTDRCKTEEEQRAVGERYRRQVELYERAMEKILKIKVKNKFLYLFSTHSVIEL